MLGKGDLTPFFGVDMKVLFLDFDGVICFGTYEGNAIDHLIPDCITQLNRVIREVKDLKIVISSTWRVYHGVEWLKDHLESAGFVYAERVIGTTPQLSHEPGKRGVPRNVKFGELSNMWMERGWEIQEWLDQHPEVEKFVIVDDDDDMVHLKDRFVQTDFMPGLTKEKADEIIGLFNDEQQD